MSHFIGLVAGNYEYVLEPYDENLEVEPYVRYTKEEAITEVRERRLSNYEWAHKILEKESDNETAKKIVEKSSYISYEDAWEEAKAWGYEMDEDENLLSTYNPDSKWDWYAEGGRWDYYLLLKERDENGNPLDTVSATKEEIDWDAMIENGNIPFCFVDEDGWYEKGEMGWWACVSNEKEEEAWIQEFKNWINKLEDWEQITAIDFHI